MDWQTPVALGLVVLAALFLLRGWFAKRKRGGSCGGDCGCPMVKKPGGKDS